MAKCTNIESIWICMGPYATVDQWLFIAQDSRLFSAEGVSVIIHDKLGQMLHQVRYKYQSSN